VRQIEQLGRFIEREVPKKAPLVVAGDLNDWGAKLRPVMNQLGLHDHIGERTNTYPSRLPITQLDFVYARGMKPVGLQVPRGRIWWRMSDHLPLIAEFRL
jgi:endonuclease/exonuclease/phosphatase family metal-dependent hydrolase